MGSQGLIYRLFSIYRGEGKRALLFCFLSFISALSLICGVTLADGLFLEEVGGSGIALSFLLTALTMLAVSTLYLYALHRFSIGQLNLGLCFMMLLFYGVLAAPQLGIGPPVGPWFWYFMKAGSYMFLAVVWTAVWSFIDQYYDLQDAKRVYGMFTACMVTGCAAGSALVYLLITRISLNGIFLVCATSVCCVMISIWIISRSQPIVHDDTLEDVAPRAEERSIGRAIRQILTSRFTMLLLLLSFLVEVATAITEFNYMDRLSETFVVDHQLTLFLAKCRVAIYVANVLFGLFFYSRSVKRFGANTLLMLPSLYFTLLFAIWPFDSGILPAILGLIAAEGILYAIDDPNFNLLLSAVPPYLKTRVRALVGNFFEPLGMLVSALLLLFFQINITILGIGVSLASVVVCIALYRRYSLALFANLSVNSIHFERRAADWVQRFDKEELEIARKSSLAGLQSKDLGTVEVAANALLELATPELLPYLLQALERLDFQARDELLTRIGESPFAEEPVLLAHIERWSEQWENRPLRGAGLLYLARLGLSKQEDAERDLSSEWLQERAAALIALQKVEPFEQMACSENPEEVALALSLLPHLPIEEPIEKLRPLLSHPSLMVERSAMKSLAQIATSEEAPLCIDKLGSSGDPEVRSFALRALGQIEDPQLAESIVRASSHFRPNERRLAESILCEMGPRTIHTLLDLTLDRTLHDRCRILAGRALGRIGLPQLQSHLLDLVKNEIERAFFYFFHYATIQKEYPELDLRLLQDALLTGYHLVIDFIIQMLGICASLEQCELLAHSLRSHNEKIHSQAVETLSAKCDRAIFQLLEPLIDDRPLQEKLRVYFEGGRRAYPLEELLEVLEESSSLVDSIVCKGLRQDLKIQPAQPTQAEAGSWPSPLALELAKPT